MVVNVAYCQGVSVVGMPPAKQADAECLSKSQYNALRFAAASNSKRIQMAVNGWEQARKGFPYHRVLRYVSLMPDNLEEYPDTSASQTLSEAEL
ncbi:MAG: hypothetical protein VX862_04715, partial [Pseudomonadota bacterium]|nr:hypothetical protein [Pseudomonadota bacterium]